MIKAAAAAAAAAVIFVAVCLEKNFLWSELLVG